MDAVVHDPAPGPTIACRLADFVAGLSLSDVPASTRRRAALLMLDAAGTALAAASFEFGRKAVRAFEGAGGGDCRVIGFRERLATRDAVLVNGILAHGLDYDDTSIFGRVHAGSFCVPVALTLGAQLHRDGAAVLAAYIAAMEVAVRIGSVAKGGFKEQGFYPQGVVGPFATSLLAGRLYGLSADQLVTAQGLAYGTASGNQEFVSDMAWTKRMHSGWAGVGGITAALLARQGFVAPALPYEGRWGLYRVYPGAYADRCDLGLATAQLGSRWEIDHISVKPVPACYFNIAAIDAALAIAREHQPDPAGIESVRVLLPQAAVDTVCEPSALKRRPRDGYAAEFSIYYTVAAALVRRSYSLADHEPAAVADPVVLALADRVRYEVDAASPFPRYYSGEVEVTMRDGRRHAKREEVHRGAPERPMHEQDIVEKFMDNARRALPPDRARAAAGALLEIERARDVAAIADLLSPE